MTDARDLSPGSYSHGTLRPQDLLRRFADVLAAHDPEPGEARLIHEARGLATALDSDDAHTFETASEYAPETVDALMDALTDRAPAGHYFGAHEGDGSDFGCWLVDFDEEE
jgi:hypothetical protein